MSPETRKKITASVDKYDNWKNAQDENSAQYIKFPVTKEKLAISSLPDVQDKTEEPYLKSFKNELAEKILKKYVPNEIVSSRAIVSDDPKSDSKRASIWSKPRLSKLLDKNEIVKTQKSKKPSIITPNKIIKDISDIPCYFNSPEGCAYIAPPVISKKEILMQELSEEPQVLQSQEIHSTGNASQKDLGQIDDPPSSEQVVETKGEDIQEDSNLQVQNATEDKIPHDPLKIDVYGYPRSQKVPLPNSIKTAKPGAIPNEKFINIEAKTKRVAKTVSTLSFAKKGGQLFNLIIQYNVCWEHLKCCHPRLNLEF